MQKIFSRIVILLSIFLLTLPHGIGQVQHWNYNQRERSQALHSQAMTQLNKKQFKRAEVLLRQANAVDATDPLPYATLGLLLAIEGEFDQALACMNKSYELGHEPETLLSTGIVYYLSRDYDAAINSWTKLISDNPHLTNILVNLGYGYMRKGDFAKANSCFDQAMKAYPSSQIAYQGLAELNYLAGKFKQAEIACQRSQAITPYAPVALLAAKVDFMQGNTSRAQKFVNEYTRLSRKKIPGRSMTALGFIPQHDFHYDPYLLEQHDNANLLLARMQEMGKNKNRARSYAGKAKAQNIELQLKKALEKTPNDFFLWHELGLVQLAQTDFTEASQSFKKAIELCPECKVDLLNLARSLYFDGKGPEAASYSRQFQKARPGQELSPVLTNIALTDPQLKGNESIQPKIAPVDNGRGENAGKTVGF